MKVEKIIKTSEMDLFIEGVTLLTTEEVKNEKEYIKGVAGHWWLQSSGLAPCFAVVVRGDGYIHYYGELVDLYCGVRPALKINLKSTDMQIGDSFWFGGYTWTVISKKRALCDNIIEYRPFRNTRDGKDANVYEKSDVKKRLDNWYNHISYWFNHVLKEED